MTPANASAIVLAVVAVIGLIAALVRWFFNRGADEREITIALKENTRALSELTTAFHTFETKALGEFRTLDVRVTKIEANGNGSNPAHRNASPTR